MLPLHLQCLFNDEAVQIVVDNAKSHVSKHHGVKRRNSEPVSTLSKKTHRSRQLNRTSSDPPKRINRWESEAYPLKNDFPPPFDTATHSHHHHHHPMMERNSLHSVLSKPVRRQSIEDPDILAQLHDSLSSIEDINDATQNTAALLAKALESLDLYDEGIY